GAVRGERRYGKALGVDGQADLEAAPTGLQRSILRLRLVQRTARGSAGAWPTGSRAGREVGWLRDPRHHPAIIAAASIARRHTHAGQLWPPPSTRITWPDTKAPCGPAKNSTTRA